MLPEEPIVVVAGWVPVNRDCLCCGGARCVAIRSRKHRFDAVCANAEKQLD